MERLVTSDTVDWFPHLSPDGRRLAFGIASTQGRSVAVVGAVLGLVNGVLVAYIGFPALMTAFSFSGSCQTVSLVE